MLELVAATVIISVAMVPTLRLTRNNLQSLERVEQSEQCHLLCVSKMEETMAQTSGTWSLGTQQGNFAASGWPQYRYTAQSTDQPGSGGRTDSLAVLTVTVWHDQNANGAADGNEVVCRLDSKLARLQALINKAAE
jgi:hypothetical protein